MAPAQYSVEIDPDIKPNFTTKKVAADQKPGNKIVQSNGKNLKYMSNFEDCTYQIDDMLGGQIKMPKDTEDMAVDVTESKRSSDLRVAVKEDLDETECSSSFAETTSGNESCSGLSDAEVESQFHEDGSLTSAFDGFGSLFPMRKKKLTGHWRSFIRPLMWRCKWTELKIKEFQSQAAKCTRELAAYDQIKHTALDKISLEESGSRSLPFIFQGQRRNFIKRRKRKKVEDTTDVTSYMSNHNLFCYRESKKSDLDGTSVTDDFVHPVLKEQNTTVCDDFGINDEWSFLEENSNVVEQTLQKIESVHTRVHKLKAQLDSIMTKYACKFSSSESLSHLVPGDAQTSFVPSPTFSACNGDTVSVGGLCSPRHVPEYDFGDFIMPDSAISSYGEAILIPDIIESTVGLLSSVDVTQHETQVGDSCEKIMDNVLIHKGLVEMDDQTFRKNNDQSVEGNHDSDNSGEEGSIDTTTLQEAASESEAVTKTSTSHEQSTLKSCLASDIHFPKNKRKRGERKGGSGGWSRQHRGEPDSH